MPLTAVAVHLFTATGAVCALFATLALMDGAYERMFIWLGVAFVIDAIDGSFARMVRVSERLPRFSGERLDLVIDYVTYVFVPVLALWHAKYLVGNFGLAFSAAILLSSLFHFSDLRSKAVDHSFVGFPAVWNLVAFYVFAFDLSPLVTGLIVASCVALTFVPWRWVHPLRVVAFRPLTLGMSALWGLAALWCVMAGFPAGPVVKVALVSVAVYAVGLSVFWRRAPAEPGEG